MYKEYSKGTLEIITGPMFSGKSDELIKRIKLLGYSGVNTLVFKPSIDKRWNKQKIISRAGTFIDTSIAKTAQDIIDKWNKKYVAVAIDEAQFFDQDIIPIIDKLLAKGVRVIVSALDTDFTGEPFEWIGTLLAKAEMIDKLTGVCVNCGKSGTMSFRKNHSTKQIEIGDAQYEVRCRPCHRKGLKKKAN